MTTLRIITFVVFATTAFATESPSIDRIETKWSPLGDIVVQHCWLATGGEQIWIAARKDFGKRKLLFSTERNAEILFSEDEEWLIINHHWGSNGSSALLFKKVAPLDYREQLDITKQAWDFFAEREHVKPPSFDHSYVEAILWASQPRAVVLELSGHLDSQHHVDSWLCIYYVDSKKFITDFDALNKKQVVLPDEKH